MQPCAEPARKSSPAVATKQATAEPLWCRRGSALVAIELGWMGPNYSISTACATANYAFVAAANHIRKGDADIMVAGGSEAAIIPVGLGGFVACRWAFPAVCLLSAGASCPSYKPGSLCQLRNWLSSRSLLQSPAAPEAMLQAAC